MENRKILIADDDKAILLAGKIFFEGKGFNIVTAEDGVKALEAINLEKPDYALLDIVMPGKNGFEVCEEIKSNENTSDIKVIIISGNVPEIEKGFDYGADDCIIKPLDWNSLVERIENL